MNDKAAAHGLIDASVAVPDAVLDVRYATAQNLIGRPVYPFAAVFVLASTARKLAEAASRLRGDGLRLRFFDGYRPLSVQRALWQARPEPGFVADPARGSHHNRGCAVDAGLCGADGRSLPMPSDFDVFGSAAAGESAQGPARRNWLTLRGAMEAAGLRGYAREWWHYVDPDGADAPLLDVPFEDLR